jgi:hypothetical protein
MSNMYGRWFRGFPGYFLWALVLLFAVGITSAQPLVNTTPAATAGDRTAQAQSFAAERLSFWQGRLSLQDWKISVEVVRAIELKPHTLGNVHWDRDTKTAVIRVLDPADYHLPAPEILPDIEFTVVHELLHLELAPALAPLQRNDADRREEEHAVNQIASALLRLDRGK